MKLYYGAAIQGAKDRTERTHVHKMFIELFKSLGHEVYTEHTAGSNKEEVAEKLEATIGPLPPSGLERTIYVRNKMIEAIEGDIDAAVFEVSLPSLGTGIEIAHAYNRKRMGLKEIPVIALYQKDYWPNKLSSMIRGITPEHVRCFELREYEHLDQARDIIKAVLP